MGIEISPYGNMLLYKKGYTAEFVYKSIIEQKLNGLRIFDHLDKLDSLDFLLDYTFLEKLHIDCMYDQDYSFLKKLTNLKDLKIGPSTQYNNNVELNSLVNLESLSIIWRKNKITGIDNCTKLSNLALIEYNETDLIPIKELSNLIDLIIKSSTIQSLNGLSAYNSLHRITLGNCKKLTDISVLHNCKMVESIFFSKCPSIKNYYTIGGLYNLKELIIVDCRDIESVNFINDTPSLHKLILAGNVNIVDGYIKPIQGIPDARYDMKIHYHS